MQTQSSRGERSQGGRSKPPSPQRLAPRDNSLAFSRWLVAALIVALLVCGAGLLLAQSGANLNLRPSSAGASPPASRVTPFSPRLFAWEMACVLVLICLNAFFSLAEYALITLRKARLTQLVEERNRGALLAQRLLENPTRLMATIQTGTTLVATLSAGLAAVATVGPLAGWLHIRGVTAHASLLALLLVTLPVAVLTLVVGEIAPKSLAVRHPERFGLLAAHPVAWMQTALSPAVVLLTYVSTALVRPFGGTVNFTVPAVNKEELEILVEQSVEHGVLESEESEMMHSVLSFGETVARRVMTPRIDITAIAASAGLSELVKTVTESGHSRIPVFEGDLDNIVGIVHAKDLLGLLTQSGRDAIPLRSVMRAPYFIPETRRGDDLLAELRRSRQQLAIVRDEYGGTSGLVTIEDLLEEIVGDIQDEYDREEPLVQVIDDCTSILDGKMGIGDINDRMGLELPEDEADTIGGFVFGLLGHQAERGERVQFGSVDFVVEATEGRRIAKVRLLKRPDRLPSEALPDDEPPANGTRPPTEDGAANSRRATVRLQTSGVETAPPALRD